MAAGDIARAMGARQNTLSSNLRILSSAGLVSARREGRSIIYSASYGGIDDLLNYLGRGLLRPLARLLGCPRSGRIRTCAAS